MNEIHYADKEQPLSCEVVLAHWNIVELHETARWHIATVIDGVWFIDIDNEWYDVEVAPAFWWYLPEVPEV